MTHTSAKKDCFRVEGLCNLNFSGTNQRERRHPVRIAPSLISMTIMLVTDFLPVVSMND
jgi:hypothetical protein